MIQFNKKNIKDFHKNHIYKTEPGSASNWTKNWIFWLTRRRCMNSSRNSKEEYTQPNVGDASWAFTISRASRNRPIINISLNARAPMLLSPEGRKRIYIKGNNQSSCKIKRKKRKKKLFSDLDGLVKWRDNGGNLPFMTELRDELLLCDGDRERRIVMETLGERQRHRCFKREVDRENAKSKEEGKGRLKEIETLRERQRHLRFQRETNWQRQREK